jgi:hypothetical protein
MPGPEYIKPPIIGMLPPLGPRDAWLIDRLFPPPVEVSRERREEMDAALAEIASRECRRNTLPEDTYQTPPELAPARSMPVNRRPARGGYR